MFLIFSKKLENQFSWELCFAHCFGAPRTIYLSLAQTYQSLLSYICCLVYVFLFLWQRRYYNKLIGVIALVRRVCVCVWRLASAFPPISSRRARFYVLFWEPGRRLINYLWDLRRRRRRFRFRLWLIPGCASVLEKSKTKLCKSVKGFGNAGAGRSLLLYWEMKERLLLGDAEFASNVNWSHATFYCWIYFLLLLTADAGRKIHAHKMNKSARSGCVFLPSFACLNIVSALF